MGISGTIRYYGCPAEEVLSGKTFMAREGVFDDLDCALTWHPGDSNIVMNMSMQAMVSVKFHFKGMTAHAAAAPHAGRSALDAVEIMNVGTNYLLNMSQMVRASTMLLQMVVLLQILCQMKLVSGIT